MTPEWLQSQLVTAIQHCPEESRIPQGDFRSAFLACVELWKPSCLYVPIQDIHDHMDPVEYAREYMEEIKSPSLTFARGGDCDDWACFVACVCLVNCLLGYKKGRPCHITNLYRDRFGEFRHLDLTLDATRPDLAGYYKAFSFRSYPDLYRDLCLQYGYDKIDLIQINQPLTGYGQVW